MESFPSELVSFIELFRSLFRAEVCASFGYVMSGILIGAATQGTVRASVFAAAASWPQRLSDLFCRHKLSHPAFMAKLVEVALAPLYPGGLPARLFWIADSTHAEKPYAQRVASVGLFHRTKRGAGRAKHLKGHCYVFAAHLYQPTVDKPSKWSSVLVGALRYVKGCSIPTLVGALATQLRLPAQGQHVWLVDRGILSRPRLRTVGKIGHGVLGRVRCNQGVYFAPCSETVAPARRPRRPRIYGRKCRVDQLRRRCAKRLRAHKMVLRVRGRQRLVNLWETEVLLRGVWRGRAQPARVIIITVPGLKLKPWYLLTTALDLEPCEAVRAYEGRYQIEVNIDAVKEWGLEHYQGRRGQGVRRWPLFLCLGQMILQFMATGVLPVKRPALNWSWYAREGTVGQVRRRLVEVCRPRIARAKADRARKQKLPRAA